MSENEARLRISFHRSVPLVSLYHHSRRRWCLYTRWFSVWVNLGKPLPKDDGWPS